MSADEKRKFTEAGTKDKTAMAVDSSGKMQTDEAAMPGKAQTDAAAMSGKLRMGEAVLPGSAPAPATAHPHDRGYKLVLKNRRVLLHMLRKYTDFEWVKDVREEDIEFEDKEFVTDKFRTYESDLICRIRHGEQEIYLFLLMELQSGMDFTMPFRLLVYMVDIWEQYFRNVPEEERERKDFRLPVVVPMVLYNGKNAWTAQRQFQEYLKDGMSFGKYGVSFEYALIDVRRLAKDLILDSNSVIDNIFYLDREREEKDFLTAVGSMMDRVAELPPDEKNLLEVWFSHILAGKFSEKERGFIQGCFRRGEKKMISGFEQMMNEKEEHARKQGIKQGIEQGVERGTACEKEHGIQVLLRTCREFGQTMETTVEKLIQNYALSPEEAWELVKRCWKS